VDLGKLLSSTLQNTLNHKDMPSIAPRAGVALIFNQSAELCMIRRTKKIGDPWSGHMAFPGGREEVHDKTLKRTAERETWEEVQIDLTKASYLGRLQDLVHPKMSVAAFVYYVHDEFLGVACPSEVEKILWLPFDEFKNTKHEGTRDVIFDEQIHTFPVIIIGEADVWGISLQFIRDLQQRMEDI
jgi:8-oxo-dGTP pyrophosphatase MutT (NUDIX family)